MRPDRATRSFLPEQVNGAVTLPNDAQFTAQLFMLDDSWDVASGGKPESNYRQSE